VAQYSDGAHTTSKRSSGRWEHPADSFDFVVCTPRWLAENFDDVRLPRWKYETENLLFGGQLVLMQRWNEAELRAGIERLCADCSGPDWGTVASRVGQWLLWEFQYKYDEYLDEVGGMPTFPAPTS
jgi:hypothetical protein